MNLEDKKVYLKGQIQNYLETRHNINTRKNFSCLNPAHDDKNPSMSLNKQANNIKCFSCGMTYDIFDLIGIDYRLDNFMDQFNQACEIYALDPIGGNKSRIKESKKDDFDYLSYFTKVRANIGDCTYLEDRGISKQIISDYGIGYDPNFNISTGGQEWQAIIIPTSPQSFMARNINADTKSKDKVRAKGSRIPFNLEALRQSDRPIYIVEGEIDALSILEVEGIAIGLGGDNNQDRLIKEIEKVGSKAPMIVAFDNDKPGHEQGENLLEKLRNIGVMAYKVNPYDDYNDPNDYLIANKKAFKESIKKQEQAILDISKIEQERLKDEYIRSNSTASHLQNFINNIGDEANTAYTPTGFSRLDNLLNGGLYEGLYIVGAISSLGKTTLVLQIADQIAQQGKDVLIFSLEMARNELIAKSISRNTIIISKENKIDSKNAKSNLGITTARRYEKYSQVEKDLIKSATQAYGEYAQNLFIYEGVGNIGVEQIKEIVSEHIRITGNKPLVVIDYLQILAPNDVRATDKQNTDKAVIELKRLSRDYKIPVLAISSLNRSSYTQEISMSAFKESGAIEYGSDCLIGLQLADIKKRTEASTDQAKSKLVRDIEAKILKFRNGRTGTSVKMKFYCQFNYFEEQGV